MERDSELFSACLNFIKTPEFSFYIKQKCDFYRSSQNKSFDFVLPVDIHGLMDFDSDLGNLVLNHLLRASEIFHKAVYVLIQSNSLLPLCQTSTMLMVSLRIGSLPNLPSYQLTSAANLGKFSNHQNLIQYEGIVTGMSTIQKYTKSARFVCSSEGCEGCIGDKFIRRHIPGAHEHQTVRKDLSCTYCGGCLAEDVSQRILAEKRFVNVVDVRAFEDEERFKYQALTACVRDDLVNRVQIGHQLSIIGLPVFNYDHQLWTLEVNNILTKDEASQTCTLMVLHTSELSRPVAALYEDRKSSPWSFGLSLAYGFGGMITPLGTYMNVKLGMLLSLLSSKTLPSGLSLLVIADDGLAVKRLLCYGACFASRCIIHSSTNHLMASVVKDRFINSSFVEGGSLLLADDGVCVLPDLSSYKKATKETLLPVLETGSFPVNVHHVPDQGLGQVKHNTGVPMVFALRCSIWSHLEPVTLKRQATTLDDTPFQSSTGQVTDVSRLLVNMFPLVFSVDTPLDSFADQLLIDGVLRSAMGCQDEMFFASEDLKKFLHLAAKLDVALTLEAQRLIHGYYLASRRVRSAESMGGLMPRTAIKTLTCLTEAHAKLNLRTEAGEFDVVMAVLLFEEVLLSKTGCSVLNVKPMSHAKDTKLTAIIGPERDLQLLDFYEQLERFLMNHAPDLDSVSEE